jgi:hypothetical protein
MKKRLASLGFTMALEPVPNLRGYDLDAINDDGGINGDYYGTSGTSLRDITSSHTAGRSAGRSAQTAGNAATVPSSPFVQRPPKRQRVDSPLPNNMHIEQPCSRDAMPPPQKTVSRMHSVRKIFPTIRKKFSGSSTKEPQYKPRNKAEDVHMYEDEHWNDQAIVTANDSHVSMSQDDYRSGTPYMSGALPVEQPPQSSNHRGSQLLSSVGADHDQADFTFRASSPVKLSKGSNSRHQVQQLPSEPSYLRLMDGLSQDNEIELGLKDPRDSAPSNYRTMDEERQVMPYSQDPRRFKELNMCESWGQRPMSHSHMPRGSSFQTRSDLSAAHRIQTDNNHNRVRHGTTWNPVTPAPRSYQQSGHQAESVVSPYVERNNRNTPHLSISRITEPQDSSKRSAVYRSQRPRMIEHESDWCEPRQLNALSFFESPVISRHPSPQRSHTRQYIERPPPSRHYQSRNLDSSGFITRPPPENSPFFRDSAYGSSRDRPTYSGQQYMHSNSGIPFPSLNRSFHARTGQVPSAMPPIVSTGSPVRTQPQWDALQRMGVRSSRHVYSRNAGHGNVY